MKRFVRRSWGWYLVLLNHRHFKVKLLRFKERCNCSLQEHVFRKELWLFLYGNGNFEIAERTLPTMQGDYVMVESGVRHRFTALTCSMVLEIQYGEKCDEEDIIRA
jgi:mannose-6-phosphate isomerase-like protein (cupin superfamily)